ncbi:uncharacterized protein LOC134275925 [Saccostrea cucullata]|uniref:uncharacterized protein LOC134275925 n=1 Tax=Saccostrea cuccullata TaxID=36930 RepID=UPI002ED31074
MSLSKYASTQETTNIARLARLILGPCTDVLRDILKKEVLPSDLSKTVKEYTDKQLKLKKRNPLNRSHLEIIFPTSQTAYSGDYSDFDISLLYLLLRNVSKIPPHSEGWGEIPRPGDKSVAANIERLRLLRNKYYGHAADPSLSESKFRAEWRNIRDIFVELENYLGTTGVYEDAINTIQTCSMDPEQEKKYIELLGDVREFHKTVDNLSSQIQTIQREMILPRDPRIANMIETTRKMVSMHHEALSHLLVRTYAFDRAKELIDTNGFVVLTGNPGTGKTTIAKYLLKQLMEDGKPPLQLSKFTDLYGSISPGNGIVVYIDNVFGEWSFLNSDVQEYTSTTEKVKALTKSDIYGKSNILIFTTRNDVYKEYISKGKENIDAFFRSSMIDLSNNTYALREAEILQMSKNYNLCKTINDNDLLIKVDKMPISIGFPQCCNLARNNEAIKQKISEFLMEPMTFLSDYFKNLFKNRTAKVAVLVYLLLCGGKVEFKVIDKPHVDLETKRVALKFVGLKASSLNDFQDSIDCYDGFLIIRDSIENICRFSHSSVQESLFTALFYLDPKRMIQDCHHSLLQKLSTSEKRTETQVLIGQDLFDDVASRIANIISKRVVTEYKSISLLALWKDSHFNEHMLASKPCISRFESCSDTNGDSMMVHFSRAGNKRWVEYLHPNSNEDERYRSLNAACSKNHYDIFSLILSSGAVCDIQTCFHAVESGNLELLLQVCEFADLRQTWCTANPLWSPGRHSLLQEICLKGQIQFIEPILSKYPFLLHITDDKGFDALQYVACFGNEHAFDILLKFGSDPYVKDKQFGHTVLTGACLGGRIDIVKYLAKKYPALLHYHTDNQGRSLLYWAAFSGKIDVFEYISNIFEEENRMSQNRMSYSAGRGKPKANGRDELGQSVLHIACENGHYEMCSYLLRKNPGLLDVCDNNGLNVLHSASLGGSVSLFRYLSTRFLNIYSTTDSGKTVLHICCERGKHMKMFKYLIHKHPYLLYVTDNEGWTVLHSVCSGGNVEMFSFLVTKGLDLFTLTNDGKSILHIACLSKKYEMCKYVTDHYPDLLKTRDKNGWTVLHVASFVQALDFLRYLLKKDIDITAEDNERKNVLHIACVTGNIEICQLLIKNSPELLHKKDLYGRTVLHCAKEAEETELVEYLTGLGQAFDKSRRTTAGCFSFFRSRRR